MSTLKSLVADYNANSWWTTYKTIDDLPCSVDLLWAITNYKSGTSLPINHWWPRSFEATTVLSRSEGWVPTMWY